MKPQQPRNDKLPLMGVVMVTWPIFRSTLRSRPNNIKGGNVRPSVGTYVRPSTKSLSDFNEIWYVHRGRWVIHDGMPYDPIQGQGHGPLKFRKLHFSNSISSAVYNKWQLANDHWFLNYSTISKFDRAGFSIFVLVFVSRDLELGAVHAVSPSTKKFFFRFQWNLVCR